jgi:hypothetical protein
MDILKIALTMVLALIIIIYYNNIRDIIITINISKYRYSIALI